MKKKVVAFLLFCVLLTQSVCASVLGSNNIYSYKYNIGEGLTLFENRFLSDQSGVGMQTEHYFEYVPNSTVKPVVTLGKYVYGGSNINTVYNYLKEKGVNTVGGINGDFFSMQTGIPLGQVVIDKKVITDDGSAMPAIGFNADGSAFIDDYRLNITLQKGDLQMYLPYYNKYLQKWNYYLYDSNYYTKITPKCKASYVTFEIIEGEPVLGSVMKLKVVNIEKDIETEKTLAENQLVLAVSDEASEELKLGLDNFSVGDECEISFLANSEKWNNATYILASSAGQIMKNGEQVGDMSGIAAPRTAVGVTESGIAVFYTIDGRQSGHSYGVRLPTLVTRMKELGCTDVLNLDGGGSTTLSAIYGGTDTFEVVNLPSEKTLRNDATYVFFENTAEKTGELTHIFAYPYQLNILSGSRATLEIKGADSGYYPVSAENTEFFVNGESTVSPGGEVTALGDGMQTLTMKNGNATGTSVINVVKYPDTIEITDTEKNAFSQKVTLKKGESIDFDAYCYSNHKLLTAWQSDYKWSVDGNMGTISEDGIFTALESGTGSVTVKAGESEKSIEITVKTPTDLCDIEGNWAQSYIEKLYEKKVVTGEKSSDGKMYYKPLSCVTRTQMAVMLAKALELDVEKYENTSLDFKDKNEIPDWALPYVKAVVGEGIIKGSKMNDGVYFLPDNYISRAEIFTTVGRILKVSATEKCPFSDREEIPDWAVDYIDALYEKGMVNGYDDNSLKPLSNITKAEISKIIVKSLFK